MVSFQDRPDQFWSRSLTIEPARGDILFRRRIDMPTNAQGVPGEESVASLARKCAALLGIDPAQLVEKTKRIQKCAPPQANEICSRGVFLARLLDGIEFYANGEDDRGGFLIVFGSFGEVESFDLIWPAVERLSAKPFPAPGEIMGWIKAGKAVLALDEDGSLDFTRLNDLTAASKLTIMKVTPYYDEVPSEASKAAILITPFLDLHVTGWRDSKTITGHLLCLIPSDGDSRPSSK
jgi:hypothetical protein